MQPPAPGAAAGHATSVHTRRRDERRKAQNEETIIHWISCNLLTQTDYIFIFLPSFLHSGLFFLISFTGILVNPASEQSESL